MRRLVDGSFVLLGLVVLRRRGARRGHRQPGAGLGLRPGARRSRSSTSWRERAEDAYIDGVFEGGWDGDDRWIRLGIRAAGVKYHWLIGLLLRDAADGDGALAYGRHVDRDQLYAARAAGLRLVTRWQDEADALAYVLGVS